MGALSRRVSGNDDMILPQEELREDRVLQSIGMAAYHLVGLCRVRKGVRGNSPFDRRKHYVGTTAKSCG